jgi:hypothetical protein
MSSVVKKTVIPKEGETSEEAITRVRSEDESKGLDASKYEYVVEGSSDKSVETVGKGKLAEIQLGKDGIDVDTAAVMPAAQTITSNTKPKVDNSKYDDSRGEQFGSATLYEFTDKSTGTRKSLPTFLRFKSFPLLGGHRIDISDEFKIGSFTNEASLEDAIDTLAQKLISTYSGTLIDPDHVPYLAKIKAPTSMGFGPEVVEQFDAQDYRSKIDFFLDREKRDVADEDGSISPYLDDVSWLAHPLEAHIRKTLEPFDRVNYVKPADYHKYIKAHFSDREHHILPLPYDHDPRFEVMYHPVMSDAFTYFMDNNIRYRNTIVTYVRSMIRSSVATVTANFDATFGQLLRALDVNVSVINRIPGITKGLRPDDASNLVINMMTALAMGRWAELEFTFSTSTFAYDVSMLIYCMFAKLVLPWQCVSEESVRSIDNYIFYWLMRADLKTNGQASFYMNLSTVDLHLNDRNFMTEAYANDLFKTPLQHQAFLHTDGMGGGWNVPGGDKFTSFGTQFARFMAPGKATACTPLNGQLYFDDVSTAPQVMNFMTFNNFLNTMVYGRGTFSPPIKNAEKQAIVATLMSILDGANTFQELSNTFNQTLLRLGSLAITYPLRASEKRTPDYDVKNIHGERIKLTCALGGPMSMYLLHPKLDTQNITLVHHETSVVITELANSLAVHYNDVNARYRKFKIFYTKSKRNDLVKARVKNHPTLSAFFGLLIPQLNDLLDGTNLPTLPILSLDNDVELQRINAMRIIIKRNLRIFGVAPHHYYVPYLRDDQLQPIPQSRGKDIFTDLFVVEPTALDIVKTYRSYEELYDDVLNEKITPIFQKAGTTPNGAIKFDFPFNFNDSLQNKIENDVLNSLPATFKLDIPSGEQQSGITGTVPFLYVYTNTFLRRDANRFALLGKPKFVIDYLPFYIDDYNINWTDFKQRVIAYNEWKVLQPKSYFTFSRRLDV